MSKIILSETLVALLEVTELPIELCEIICKYAFRLQIRKFQLDNYSAMWNRYRIHMPLNYEGRYEYANRLYDFGAALFCKSHAMYKNRLENGGFFSEEYKKYINDINSILNDTSAWRRGIVRTVIL